MSELTKPKRRKTDDNPFYDNIRGAVSYYAAERSNLPHEVVKGLPDSVKLKLGENALELSDADRERKEFDQRLDEAETDPLLGLLNRRRFKEKCSELESSNPGLLLEFEFDVTDLGFSNGQPDIGEPGADQMLIGSARTIQSILRPEALVCRWGGDEIKGVIPLADISEAEPIIDRLRQSFQGRMGGAEWKINENTIVLLCGRFGFSVVDTNKGETIDAGLLTASEEMYKEKKRQAEENEACRDAGMVEPNRMGFLMRYGFMLDNTHAA